MDIYVKTLTNSYKSNSKTTHQRPHTKVDFVQVGSKYTKLLSATQRIKRIKVKSLSFKKKKSQELEGAYLSLTTVVYNKPVASITLNGRKTVLSKI